MNAVRSSFRVQFVWKPEFVLRFVKTLASCSTVIIWSMNERMCLSPHKLNRGNDHVVHSVRTKDTKDYKCEMVAHFRYVTIHHY